MRQEGSTRNKFESKTKKLWYKEYKTPLSAPGTLYRGSTPDGTLCDFDKEAYDASISKGGLLTVESIEMEIDDKSTGTYDCGVSLVCERGDEVDLMLNDMKIGKGFKVDKGHYLWDRDTEYRGKLPFSVKVALNRKYTLTVNVIKRGKLKGLIASKDFQK